MENAGILSQELTQTEFHGFQGVIWGRNDSGRGSSLRPPAASPWIRHRRLGLSSSWEFFGRTNPWPQSDPSTFISQKSLIIPGWKKSPKWEFGFLTVQSCRVSLSQLGIPIPQGRAADPSPDFQEFPVGCEELSLLSLLFCLFFLLCFGRGSSLR